MLSPIIILGIFSIVIIQDQLNTEIREKNIQIIQQTNHAVEAVFGTIDLIGSNFDTNAKNQQLLKSILNQPVSSQYTKDEYTSILYFTNMLRSYQNSSPYIFSIYLYANNQYRNSFSSIDSITNSSTDQEAAWLDSYKEMKANQSHLICKRSLEEFHYESGNVQCITISREIQNTSYSNTKAGIVVVNFRKNMIENLIKSQLSTPGSAFFVLDAQKNILASASEISGLSDYTVSPAGFPKTGVSEWAFKGNKYICFSDKSEVYNISLVSLVPEKSFYKHSFDILYITIILLFVSLLIGTAISYYIAHRNYLNLNLVLNTINAAENNEPLPVVQNRPRNEYQYVLQNMINLFIKQSNYRTQTAEEKYAMRTMELNLLQAQISPHFLYNTLRIIFWKTVKLTGSPNEASKMIEYLSDILSFVFSVKGNQVSLEKEISYTKSYLDIQRIRYEEKFSVVWYYDESLVNARIIKLILQPILENSLYHGIAPGIKEHYFIKISIEKRDNSLHIQITDNGIGMSRSRLREVRTELDKDDNSGQHIGLSNVKMRLAVLYKRENIGFSIYSKLNFGTTVKMFFPYEENLDE